jgi:8-hydroxy-5-deazaflavin:NADPH oxidoreductase
MIRVLLALAVLAAPLDAAAQERPTVAIIGTGNLAGIVGPAIGAQGYTVIYGSREPDRESVRALVARTGANSSATDQRAAAERADVVILAVPAPVLPEVSASLGDLTGKIIVTVAGTPRRIGSDGYLELTGDSTYAERLQHWHPKAQVIRMFIPFALHFLEPAVLGTPPTVPIVGNEPRAKEVVARIIFDVGLDPWDAGPLRYDQALDALGMLLIVPFQQGRTEGVELTLLRSNIFSCLLDLSEIFNFGAPYDRDNPSQFPQRSSIPAPCAVWREKFGPRS